MFLVFLLFNCSKDKAERDNPLDPGGVNFRGWQTPVLSGPSESSSYTLTWSDVAAGVYIIEESKNDSFTNATQYNVNSTSYRFSHSDEGEIYYYRVKTNTGNKDSYWSNIVSIVIPSKPSIDITFVTISGGTFQMGDIENAGSSDEKPVHTVTLSSFEMSTTEITNAQYAAYLTSALESGDITATSSSVTGKTGDYSGEEYLDLDNSDCEISYNNGSFSIDSGKEDRPVIEVTWYGSKAFALYYGLDLPTESEWEYAARGGKQYKYGTDDGTINSSKANYNGNVGDTTDVGSYPANLFGLYDMSGSVWEWCNDWYGGYSSDSVTNPTSALTGSYRVNRGGSWLDFAYGCRSASRGGSGPDNSYGSIGFRVVLRSSSQNY